MSAFIKVLKSYVGHSYVRPIPHYKHRRSGSLCSHKFLVDTGQKRTRQYLQQRDNTYKIFLLLKIDLFGIN